MNASPQPRISSLSPTIRKMPAGIELEPLPKRRRSGEAAPENNNETGLLVERISPDKVRKSRSEEGEEEGDEGPLIRDISDIYKKKELKVSAMKGQVCQLLRTFAWFGNVEDLLKTENYDGDILTLEFS